MVLAALARDSRLALHYDMAALDRFRPGNRGAGARGQALQLRPFRSFQDGRGGCHVERQVYFLLPCSSTD